LSADLATAITFGAFTFTLPFVLGIAFVLPFGYGFATAMLFGSLWASHTLVAYPIVQEHGLLRDRAVGVAGGGTVMTDTLALSVLAVVAGSVASDSRPAVILLEVAIGLVVLALVCAFLIPRVTRWVFAGAGQHRGARFLFVLVALTGAALVADRAGIEGIVGAFFAGLALNRLVPARSRLMEQVEFVGGVLLIPFFLLSTGMLIDPEKFTERRVLAIAALSMAVVFVGKATAAYLSGRVLGLARSQVRLLFGLSLAQAAATLAAVTIGVEIGLFDDDLLNATLVVVLVTVLVSSIVTRSAARSIEPPPVQGERLAERILVPVDEHDDPAVVRLAARLALAKGGNVLVGALAPTSGAPLDEARARAKASEQVASAVGAEAESVVRVDTSPAAALAAIVAEHEATLIVTSWRRAAVAADVVLGGQGGRSRRSCGRPRVGRVGPRGTTTDASFSRSTTTTSPSGAGPSATSRSRSRALRRPASVAARWCSLPWVTQPAASQASSVRELASWSTAALVTMRLQRSRGRTISS
jgi:Kef-type K+ transport system membrane component KefB